MSRDSLYSKRKTEMSIYVLIYRVMDYIMTGTEMNGLAAIEYNSLNSSTEKIRASLSYINLEYEELKNETTVPILYIDRVEVRDMFGNT